MIDPRFTYAEIHQTEDRAPHGTGFAIAIVLALVLIAALNGLRVLWVML